MDRRELKQSGTKPPNRLSTTRRRRHSLLLPLVALALITLACSVIQTGSSPDADQVVFLTRLPTFTRTPLPTLTPTPPASAAEGVAPVAEATDQPGAEAASILNPVETSNASAPAATPISGEPLAAADAPVRNSSPTASEPVFTTAPMTPSTAPTITPTVPPNPDRVGWEFAGVQNFPDQDGGNIMLYGDIVNRTGTAQEISLISGTFFDAQGQMIADSNNAVDYWPVEIIPPSGRVPFELTVYGIQGIANFDLAVEAEQSTQMLREDFEFLDLIESNDGETHCVTGRLRNPGEPLQNYVVIVAVLYDDQDNVVNFGEFYEPVPGEVTGDTTLDFEICVTPVNLNVARYEMRAWGL